MIHCKTLNKDFETKEEMFKELKANEDKIISLKKAAVMKSCDKGQFSPNMSIVRNTDAAKAALNMKADFIYPVINTTKYMDSHDDVHFDGIWNKSLKDNTGKLYYIMDHELSIKNVIAYPKNVKAYVKMLPWSMLGKDYEGETQALIYEIAKSSISNSDAIKAIESNEDLQNSVRMQYVKVKFAVNSDDKDYAENKAYFDSRIEQIANKDEVLKQGYFYGVEEAKIYKEGSMVLFGSNDATPILQNTGEPLKGTIQTEPEESTQTEKSNLLLNLFN